MECQHSTTASENRPYHQGRATEELVLAKRKQLEEGTTDFGSRLVELRKARGLTQVEMAERLGTTQSFVSKYERGELRLHGELIIKLAAALDVTTDELLGFSGKEPSVQPAVKDRRLWRRLTAIDRLSKRDRAALVRTIDAFLSKAQPA
jgi:transcriptional regulator with XRE-family HTH domain